jgi:hypothetical protein
MVELRLDGRPMKLTGVLAVLIGTLILACSTAAPAPAEPSPNIDGTVEAKLAQERAVDATVEARLKEETASQATSIPSPTNTPAPIPTYTPNPTYTPKLVPTATSVPTPMPTPAPIPRLGTLLSAAFAPVELQSEECPETIWPGGSNSSPSLAVEWGTLPLYRRNFSTRRTYHLK